MIKYLFPENGNFERAATKEPTRVLLCHLSPDWTLGRRCSLPWRDPPNNRSSLPYLSANESRDILVNRFRKLLIVILSGVSASSVLALEAAIGAAVVLPSFIMLRLLWIIFTIIYDCHRSLSIYAIWTVLNVFTSQAIQRILNLTSRNFSNTFILQRMNVLSQKLTLMQA